MGKGYTPAFVRNLDVVAARITAGAEIALVEGPDDMCGPMLDEPTCHCHKASVVRRDALARADLTTLLGRDVFAKPFRLDDARTERMRVAFAAETIRAACRDCPWDTLCSSIARDGFREVRMRPSVAPTT